MSSIKAIKIEQDLFSHILEISNKTKFSTEANLFYEGQIPIVAYLIVEGTVQLLKKKKLKYIIKPGNIIGIDELMKNIPSKLSARVLPETILCFLDKSTLKEIMENPHSHLFKIFTEDESA